MNLGWLKLLFPGSIWAYVGAGVAMFAVGSALGGYAGHRIQAAIDAPIISQAKADLATSRQETAEQKTALADFRAQVEKDRADANAKALETQTALQAQITDLTSKNNAAQRARAAASDELLKVLHAIPPEKQAAISPGVRDFLCRVRVQQGSADASSCASASGNPDQDRVPATP